MDDEVIQRNDRGQEGTKQEPKPTRVNELKENYDHRFLQGGNTKNGILGNQLYFMYPKKEIFCHDFEGFNKNLRMQSLPKMNGAPGVSTSSFTLVFPKT